MTSKKEPPFFSEDKDGLLLYKQPFTMELFIETLTGTCFELRVSPFETVASVKAKIQRLEGIPITQQHLIWNNIDLQDDISLNDYKISEGCTLKLVLAMRAGPINTRRVPLEDSVRELAELVDPVPDDVQDKLSANKQVTFLLYRDGEQMNFFRVVDRRNSTLSPLSESLSGGSTSNLYAEDEDEMKASLTADQIIDNSITRIKMKLLKSKMASMDLNKKLRRCSILKPRPPMAPRPSNSSIATSRQRLLRVLPHIGQTRLPPGNPQTSESSHNALSKLAATTRTITAVTCDNLKEKEALETSGVIPSFTSITFSPHSSILESANNRPSTSTVLPKITPLPKIDMLTKKSDPLLHANFNVFSTEEMSRVGEECLTLVTDVRPPEPYEDFGLSKVKSEFELAEGEKAPPTIETQQATTSNALNSDLMETGILNATEVSPPRNTFLSPIHFYTPVNDGLFPKTQHQPKCFDLGSLRPPASNNLFHSLQLRSMADPTFSRTARFKGMQVESPNKRSDVISNVEATDMIEVANKSSKDSMDSLNNLRLFASLARSESREHSGRYQTVVAPSVSLQSETISSLNEKRSIFTAPHGLAGIEANAVFEKHTVEATHLFPPIKPVGIIKKKMTKHCFLCRRRTNLATSFECRCGNNFCATHRYAESHNCTYDYKTAGRRHLQEANPVITAPKLPKI